MNEKRELRREINRLLATGQTGDFGKYFQGIQCR